MAAKMYSALLLMGLMLLAPLSGCIGGTPEEETIDADATLTIDGMPATEAAVRLGEWHDLLLVGEGLRLSAPADDVLLFVNGSMDLDSSVPVDGDRQAIRLLTTPYTEAVELTIYDQNGRKTVFELPVENGTPIVNGQEWFEKMDYITCDPVVRRSPLCRVWRLQRPMDGRRQPGLRAWSSLLPRPLRKPRLPHLHASRDGPSQPKPARVVERHCMERRP